MASLECLARFGPWCCRTCVPDFPVDAKGYIFFATAGIFASMCTVALVLSCTCIDYRRSFYVLSTNVSTRLFFDLPWPAHPPAQLQTWSWTKLLVHYPISLTRKTSTWQSVRLLVGPIACSPYRHAHIAGQLSTCLVDTNLVYLPTLRSFVCVFVCSLIIMDYLYCVFI